jgi:hypothetical protein
MNTDLPACKLSNSVFGILEEITGRFHTNLKEMGNCIINLQREGAIILTISR